MQTGGNEKLALRRPDDFKHHSVQLKDVKMHYVMEGKGEPIVLIHGWPGFWWEWNANIGPLAETHTVIVPDMRGYGDSEKPDLNDLSKYHIDRTVDDMAQLLDHLGYKDAYWVGHDWSAIVMHKFVRQYREKVKRVVWFNADLPGIEARYLSVPHFQESWYSQFHQWPMSWELVTHDRETVKIYFRHFFNHWSSPQNPIPEEELEVHVDNLVKPGNVQGGFNFYRSNLNVHTSVVWTPLDRTLSDVPAVFLWGVDDPVVAVTWSDYIPDWYTNFIYKALPNVGHFVMREATQLVNNTLREFFRSDVSVEEAFKNIKEKAWR